MICIFPKCTLHQLHLFIQSTINFNNRFSRPPHWRVVLLPLCQSSQLSATLGLNRGNLPRSRNFIVLIIELPKSLSVVRHPTRVAEDFTLYLWRAGAGQGAGHWPVAGRLSRGGDCDGRREGGRRESDKWLQCCRESGRGAGGGAGAESTVEPGPAGRPERRERRTDGRETASDAMLYTHS